MSLVEDWKDRVPTEVLSNGAIRYEQFDSSGNSLGYIYIKRADEPLEVGNIWNKNTYDGIKGEFGNVLYIAEKATQSEAEEGINDTKYMTPIKTKASIAVEKVINNSITTSSSGDNTINLSSYIHENTKKIEVVINATFSSRYRGIFLNGTSIGKNAGPFGSTEVDLAGHAYIDKANLIIAIFPQEKLFRPVGAVSYSGSASGTGTGGNEEIETPIYYYESISDIEMGTISSGNISIIEYKY